MLTVKQMEDEEQSAAACWACWTSSTSRHHSFSEYKTDNSFKDYLAHPQA